ncbi:MAG TPA: phosphoenolpyruvate hydrolase family protein [Planctomycetota bacterium]|nr:phosphoenolpyruvate hydrolase family protein [Planctomycetota bacterium]
MNRGRILEAWRKKIAAGAPLRGGPAGPDFITVVDLTVAGLLPLADANARSLEKTRSRAVASGSTPLIAGVCATDPLRLMRNFLEEMKAAGAAGVQNAPSVGMIDGGFRKSVEDTRLGYEREVEMIALASKMDLVASAVAFTPEEATRMVEAGADVVVASPGVSDLKTWPRRLTEIATAAREAGKGVLVFAIGSEGDGVDGIQSTDGRTIV